MVRETCCPCKGKWSWLLVVALAATGCSTDQSVDEKLAGIVQQRSSLLGPETLSPRRNYVDPAETKAQNEKVPDTRNPQADTMTYRAASEARDVAARLDAFGRESLTPREGGPPLLVLDLAESFRIAQRSAREFLTAEEDYILSGIRLLIERHLWGPRLFNDTSVQFSGAGRDGSYESAVRVINDLKVTQRLPYGGSVEAGWIWDATEQLREQASGRYTQSSTLALSGNIPLLRGAGLVAQENLIQAERNLVYQARTFERERRGILVQVAEDYFELVQTQSQIINQERSLASLQKLEEATKAKVAAGRLADFEASIASNRVITAQADLGTLRERYILQVDRFKVRLGLDPSRAVEISPLKLDLAEPDISLDEASATALDLRLDLQNQRDAVDDARRSVANARNSILPDLNVNGSVAIPTEPDSREGGLGFSHEDASYLAGITFGLPLDREIERLGVRSAIVNFERAQREYERQRDTVFIEVRAALRNVDLARFRLNLAERQVEINRRRLEEQNLKADQVDAQTIVDSENDLLNAENTRDRARTDLRTAILRYLYASDQLRVKRDGTFQPLPGMEAVTAPAPGSNSDGQPVQGEPASPPPPP